MLLLLMDEFIANEFKELVGIAVVMPVSDVLEEVAILLCFSDGGDCEGYYHVKFGVSVDDIEAILSFVFSGGGVNASNEDGINLIDGSDGSESCQSLNEFFGSLFVVLLLSHVTTPHWTWDLLEAAT